jgi:hypothetical protein
VAGREVARKTRIEGLRLWLTATAVMVASVLGPAIEAGASQGLGTPANPLVLGCGAEASTPNAVPQKPSPGDLAAGPLIIPGGRNLATADPSGYGEHGQYKVPFIVKMGATVTVIVGPSARGYVRIDNPYSPVGPVTAVTYRACAHTAGFYAQSFVFEGGRTRGCVPLTVKAAPTGTVRRLTVSLLAGNCQR